MRMQRVRLSHTDIQNWLGRACYEQQKGMCGYGQSVQTMSSDGLLCIENAPALRDSS